MRAILMATKSRQVVKILSHEKVIEIRKTAPKDWEDYLSGKTVIKPEPKTVYIYCTKEPPFLDVAEPYDYDGMMYIGREYILFEKSKKMPKPSVPMYVDLGDGEYELDNLWEEYSRNEDLKKMEKERKDGSIYGEHYQNLNGKVVAKFTLKKCERIIVKGPWYDCYYHTETCTEDDLLRGSCLMGLEGYLKGNKGYAYHISDLVIFDEPKKLSDFRSTKVYVEKPRRYTAFPRLDRAPQSWCYVEE